MRISELARCTSATYTWSHVWSEVVELLEARSWAEILDELRDVISTAALYLHYKWGVDFYFPRRLFSAQKYLDRMDTCGKVLKEAGLYDAVRDKEDPYYWRRYTTEGSNMERPHKKRAFLENARLDMKSPDSSHM